MKKVLIVDDEDSLRMLISATLEDEEWEIFEAEDGISGLEKAQEIIPDLLILDMMMPGITGLEVCQRLKSNPATAGIKVLLLTAKGQQRDQEAAWEAGVDYFFAKPFSPSKLLLLVSEILSK
ncbi:response regulator receiver protein [Desulforamulus reducens MI-1]|uniref:Stage 0 sporulation protein A homolog n=1 Tax=Desulforamulus reducens (strain ATCC BAA-1160 / DSM 100696 / MI-1) TaxID=349161 RepID=A4J4T0_DESRM|nr:response regulator [Desulforamulus reducens]ABO50083.1 response regulator receiver protein [Desulforamulus reducens MI-1]